MAEVVFLGVGGALAQAPAGDHTALLVRAGASTLLLDSGPSIMRQLELAGAGVEALTHVYLSHQHGDHSLGLPMVLLHRALWWPERPLTVMAAPEVLEAVGTIVTMAYPDLAARLAETIEFVPLATQAAPLPCPSAPDLRYSLARAHHSVPTWAIRLDLESGASLVMSGDTGPADAVSRLAHGATLLVHDTYYLTPPLDAAPLHSAATQVGELASAAGVHAVALVHRKDTSQSAAAAYRDLAARHFDGQIHVPQSGDVAAL